MSRREIVAATHNRGKLGELHHLLEPLGWAVVSASAIELPEPDETGDSYEANAILKARAAANVTGTLALADDSGFEIEGLGGRPGLHTARVARAAGGFRTAMGQLWAELRHRQGPPERPDRAVLICVLALAWPDGRVALGHGRADGALQWPPSPEPGPGFLPFFRPLDGSDIWVDGAVLRQRAMAFDALRPVLDPARLGAR